MAKVTINGEVVKVKSGTTILNAVNSIGIEIPTLCFIKEINEIGFCRICVVEVEGEQDLVSACNTEIKNGMVITTDSEKVMNSRTATLQLLASKHRFDCWRCPKDGMCEFYDLLKQHDVTFEEFGPGYGRNKEQIKGSGISQDQTKCILCKRCVAVCSSVVTAKVLKFRDDDGINPIVSPTPGLAFDEAGCIFCGQCVKSCPTGTLFETSHTNEVEALFRKADTKVVAQINKVAAVALQEEFGYEMDTPSEETFGRTMQALKQLGFDEVTTLDFGADMQAYMMGQEFVERLENNGTFPMITTTCPSTTRYFELYKPELLDHLSKVKTPHIVQGDILKKELLKDQEVKVVTIDTCTAKKYEITRDELNNEVDYVLTVRELAKLMKRKNIKLDKVENVEYQETLTGERIPPVQGDELIATLNTVSELLDQKALEPINFKVTTGKDWNEAEGFIQEATVLINGQKLNVAVVLGSAAFKTMFAKMEKKQYHLIKMMTCPGGCVNGGGMPLTKLPLAEVIEKRLKALGTTNPELPYTNPTHNSLVTKLYNDKLKQESLTTYSQKEFKKE